MFSKLRNKLERMLGVQSPSQMSIEACKRMGEMFEIGLSQGQEDEALKDLKRKMKRIIEGESLRENDQETG